MRIIDLREQTLPEDPQSLLPRPKLDINAAVDVVTPLLAQVRDEGAAALYRLDEQFDRVRPASLRVPKEDLERALKELQPKVRHALELAVRNARLAHEAQLPTPRATEVVPGGVVYQRWVPLGRVGLYVPGGLAVYPSSVVMNVVAAQVAGVDSMVVASPPQKQFGGLPHPTILAACQLLGVSEVIAVGGAQAIGAMAYGFADGDYRCRPVDKVTGPGNIYVAAAKRVVQQVCGIDSEAGTTEIAVLADDSADPRYVAADLISQAEHDPAAASVLFTDSAELVAGVTSALADLVGTVAQAKRIESALGGPQSAIVLTDSFEQALELTQAYAPEHLEVQCRDALGVANSVTTAGAVFVGDYSPVPLGDYVAGSNHVLPTGGTARYSSGLNVTQFLRSVQVVDYSKGALRAVGHELVTLAESEGLPAHGLAARLRFSDEEWADTGEDDTPRQSVRLPWRPELADVEPYGAPMIDVPVRLNVNENPYPPDPDVVDAIAQAVRDAASKLNRYADRDALALREDLADYVRLESGVEVTASQVWAANGSNEVMIQLLQAFGGPGRSVMALWPTYSMYEEYARNTNTGWILEKTGERGRFDADALVRAMQQAHPAVVLVPSPNNPTGEPVDASSLGAILEASVATGPTGEDGLPTASLVVVDEAYSEFRDPGQPSALELLSAHPNLVVTRTMSKAFAAAGLRLGYLVADPAVVREIQKVRLPYHLSLLTQAAARAALAHADAQLRQVDQIRQSRQELSQWLTGKGLDVYPSASNFLLFGPLPDRHEVWEALVEAGVLIREVGPHGYLRVTVGTPSENETFKTSLERVL